LLVFVPASVTLCKPVGIAQIMNYALQVVRGRSGANTLKLMDGVNSIGRHDDCVIRIRSSQVSRRHCELFEEENKLILRDLGSSNGTFVNGIRVLGKQTLKPGDVLTIGGVTLRVELLREASKSGGASSAPQRAPGDTAEVKALPAAEDDFEMELEEDEEEFEVALENEPDHLDIIPLDDEPPSSQPSKAAKPAAPNDHTEKAKGSSGNTDATEPTAKPQSADEEDAVAQFLLDLKLDEDD
jgi:pSer/pThr/pTyr-binding forkhead associated (FHA) protein